MNQSIRPRYVLASVVLAVCVMVLAVLVPSQGADAVDGPVDVVFVARSDEFADALAGGPLAALRGAPMLLTRTDTLEPDTIAELERLDPDRIIILGGPVAISESTEAALEQYAGPGGVDRIAGATRFETAAKIAEQLPAKAADADLLDGKDSSAFLGAGDKAADADKLDGLDATAFASAAIAKPFVVQLAAGTYVEVATSGPLTVAAFCNDLGGGDVSMNMMVRTTVDGAYNEDETGTFDAADGWQDINDTVNPGPGEYENEIDEGIAIVRDGGTIHVISVDGEINGFGEGIYGQDCTVNGIVNSYSGPAGLTSGAQTIPAP